MVNGICRALFVSSSVIFCSIKYCALAIAFGWPVIVTIRFLVPGANMPFFEICTFAPETCWISTKLRPFGPVILIFHYNWFLYTLAYTSTFSLYSINTYIIYMYCCCSSIHKRGNYIHTIRYSCSTQKSYL